MASVFTTRPVSLERSSARHSSVCYCSCDPACHCPSPLRNTAAGKCMTPWETTWRVLGQASFAPGLARAGCCGPHPLKRSPSTSGIAFAAARTFAASLLALPAAGERRHGGIQRSPSRLLQLRRNRTDWQLVRNHCASMDALGNRTDWQHVRNHCVGMDALGNRTDLQHVRNHRAGITFLRQLTAARAHKAPARLRPCARRASIHSPSVEFFFIFFFARLFPSARKCPVCPSRSYMLLRGA